MIILRQKTRMGKNIVLGSGSAGFSLVELMVVLFLTAISAIVMYRSYLAMQVGVEVQAREAELHQNMRVGIDRLAESLRMAGYKPFQQGMPSAETGFTVADSNTVRITTDFNGDNDIVDSNFNGEPFSDDDVTFAWSGLDGAPLRRNDNGACPPPNECWQNIIPNISSLNFVYLDRNGSVLTAPVALGIMTDIRQVEVAVVVRASAEDYSYTNGETYNNLQGTLLAFGNNDNFRRRLVTARVKIRNMGL